jgi:hypothetical protein
MLARNRRHVAVIVAVVISASAVFYALAPERSTGVASALPPALEQSLSSSEARRSFDIKSATVESHETDSGTTVFVATDESEGTCVGLSDGGAACGSPEDAAAGRLFLMVVDVAGRHVDDNPLGKQQGKPAAAHLYGLQPNVAATAAKALDTQGKVLDDSQVRDGVYQLEFAVGAGSARLAEVRFTTVDGNSNEIPALRLAD